MESTFACDMMQGQEKVEIMKVCKTWLPFAFTDKRL